MQFRYLVFGLLLAGIFVGVSWVNNQPGIAPVRMSPDSKPKYSEQPATDDAVSRDSEAQRPFVLDEPAATQKSILPRLNDSDQWVRSELSETALPWLAETELVRTAATILENAARGEIPRKQLGFLAPKGRFQVRKIGSLIQVDPESYNRYTPFVKTLQKLPPEKAAAMFNMAEPLLAEAVRELGATGVSPRDLVYTALGVALDTPRVDAATTLRQPKVVYTYANKELEELLPLQKQLLRLGPRNLHTLRLWLEDFGIALSPVTALEDEEPVAGVGADDLSAGPSGT